MENLSLKKLSLLKRVNLFVQQLRYQDPGLLRLKMTVKVVLGMAVSFFAFKNVSVGMSVSALFAAFALSQTTDGNTLRERKVTMLMASAAIAFCIGLGGIAVLFPRWNIAITAVLAFFAYYVRRFGRRYFGFPTFAFIGYLIAAISPGNWYLSSDRIVGVIGVVPIIYFINFYIFPKMHLRSVMSHLHQTFFQIETLLMDCRVQFDSKKRGEVFMRHLKEPLDLLREGLGLSRNLLDDQVGEIKPAHKKYQKLFFIQRDIVKSLVLLIHMLKDWEYEEDKQVLEDREKLSRILKLFEKSFGDLGSLKGIPEFSLRKDLKEAIEDFEQDVSTMKRDAKTVRYLNIAFILEQIRILLVEVTSRIQKHHAESWQKIQ